MIKKIEFLKQYFSLQQGLVWADVPAFAVICGVNGAGKTQLLTAINEASQQPEVMPHRKTKTVKFSPSSNYRNRVCYVPINHNLDDISKDAPGTTSHVEKRNADFLKYVGQVKESRNNSDYNIIITEIEKSTKKNIEDLSDKQVIEAVSPDIAHYLENGFSNKFIAEVFQTYQSKILVIKSNAHDSKRFLEGSEIYTQIGSLPPWVIINSLFEKYKFSYSIKKPVDTSAYIPMFVDEKNKVEISFSELSSGEKIIVSLILWACNKHLGNKIKILLLDEFDAHLNPSMSKMFIEVVKEKLVKEFGIQVILTTHSPSTVAHVDDEDLFWMERGQDIKKSTKKEIIPVLSDGVMTWQETAGLLTQVLSSDKTVIIFTEGKTDVEHIKTAREKLDIDDVFEVFSIGSASGGADKLRQFLISCPKALFPNHKVIGIFDHDDQGCKQTSRFNPISDGLYVSCDNEDVFAILLPVPAPEFEIYKNCPIEFLYSKEVLVEHKMLGGKRPIADINSHQKDAPFNNNDYLAMEDLWFYKLSGDKAEFAKSVGNFGPDAFVNFKLLFTFIEKNVLNKVVGA